MLLCNDVQTQNLWRSFWLLKISVFTNQFSGAYLIQSQLEILGTRFGMQPHLCMEFVPFAVCSRYNCVDESWSCSRHIWTTLTKNSVLDRVARLTFGMLVERVLKLTVMITFCHFQIVNKLFALSNIDIRS